MPRLSTFLCNLYTDETEMNICSSAAAVVKFASVSATANTTTTTTIISISCYTVWPLPYIFILILIAVSNITTTKQNAI
jgi:hypothetical protein